MKVLHLRKVPQRREAEAQTETDDTASADASTVSSAFVDLDGDCVADLFVQERSADWQTVRFEIWLGGYGGGSHHDDDDDDVHRQYRRHGKVLQAPRGTGRVSFEDMDRDGAVDLVFHVCWPPQTCSERNDIVVWYNSQRPLCPPLVPSSAQCRGQQDLCTGGDFLFDEARMVSYPLGTARPYLYRPHQYRQHTTAAAAALPTLRIGDYNLDEYPDILLTVMDSDSSGNTQQEEQEQEGTRRRKKSRVMLLRNVACDATRPECHGTTSTSTSTAASPPLRTFEPLRDGVQALDALSAADDAFMPFEAFFFDLDESGALDVVVMSHDPSSGRVRTHVLYNNLFNDAFFLKTLGLNGVCPAFCTGEGVEKFPDPKPYGVNAPGVTVKFTLADTLGVKHARVATQLTQTAHLALQMPYHLFGLHRANSHIEEFFMGVPTVAGRGSHRMWTAIIPNSQLIGIPHPVDRPARWELELFATFPEHMVWVVAAVVATLLALGVPIVLLFVREKRADREERKRRFADFHGVFVG